MSAVLSFFMFYFFIIKQHSNRWCVFILKLAAFDRPQKGEQKADGNDQTDGDEEYNCTHYKRPRFCANSVVIPVVKRMTVMELAGISTAAIRGDSVPLMAKPSPMIL